MTETGARASRGRVRPRTGTRGRPRDPETEQRALHATLEVFGRKGLAGLTIDEVATASKVGKSSIYLRWSSKEMLLAAALRQVQVEAVAETDVDGTSDDDAPTTLRDFLIAHAQRRAALYLGEYGLAMLRLYAEARAYPELFAEIREQAISRFVLDERRHVEDAIRAGALPPHASPVRILDAVEGAIFMHILVTPPELLPRVRAGLDEYVELMVDDQLRAAGYDAVGDRRRVEAAAAGTD